MLLSIVIPVYNSEETIGPLVDLLIKEIQPTFQLEIILVNDYSKDTSDKVCQTLADRYKGIVRFYSLAKNVGEHNAVMAGLNQVKGDYIVIMDDDFQNPVSEVIKLATYAKDQDFDVVYTYYKEKKHSGLRNLGSQFNDRVATVMLKKPRDLYLSSFKIINKFLVSEIIKYTNPFCYIDGLILQITSNIGKIEVMHEERKAGKSGYTFKKLFSLWMNMFTNFSILPLRVAIATGFLFAIVGFLFGIYVIIDKLINPATPLGYTSLMVAIAIFSGVQLIAVGMVGEYLGRLFLANNKKPQYVIRKRFE